VRELRGVVQQQQIKLADMQMDFNELRMQHNQLKHDLRAVKVSACFNLLSTVGSLATQGYVCDCGMGG